MAVKVVQVVGSDVTSEEVDNSVRVVTVAKKNTTLNETGSGFATEVVRPGGTVANISYGTTLPPSPSEGQIFILTS